MSQPATISVSKLRWRCRRGMLELDLLLNTFLEMEYNHLSNEDVVLFSTLLDSLDQDLLDLLLGKTEPPDSNIGNLINRIRRSCHD